MHTKNIRNFLKSFWLDILAVFPFFLLFRAFEEIAAGLQIGEFTERSQNVLHEGLELQKKGTKLLQEAEKAIKIREATRFSKFSRFLRPIARLP